jgi:hypothetical protein
MRQPILHKVRRNIRVPTGVESARVVEPKRVLFFQVLGQDNPRPSIRIFP